MVKLYIRHTVADFPVWKKVYDNHDSTRKQFGCVRSEVFTNNQNPNDVLSVHHYNLKEDAVKFIQSPDLKDAMAHAGVKGTPEFNITE
jgi:quinol monooxygenase YgiN